MRIAKATAKDGRVFHAVANGAGYNITRPESGGSGALGRILRPQAATRWILPSLAAITPQYIEQTLRGALAGNHSQAWELMDLMEDSWPRLRSNVRKIKDGVRTLKPVISPYCEEETEPTPLAQEKEKLCSAALRGMRPEAAADENGLDGTIYDILDAVYKGVSVLEIAWQLRSMSGRSRVMPRATYWVHPTCYAWGQDGRLGLRRDMQGVKLGQGPSQPLQANIIPFPPNKFLISICKSKTGAALGGALLRPLAWWWCASNFSADWLLNLAQVFGLPFRWANYSSNAPQATVDAICNMLQNMGSAGWAAFPEGTTLELKAEGTKNGKDTPQGDMLDRADKQADILILGQTLTSDSGGSGSGGGSLALGQVHESVEGRIVYSAAKHAANVLETELFRPLLLLNYGNEDDCPTLAFEPEQSEDMAAKATLIQTLATAGAGEIIGLSWLAKTFGIPTPAEGERTLADTKPDMGEMLNGFGAANEATPGVSDKVAALQAIQDPVKYKQALQALAEELTL